MMKKYLILINVLFLIYNSMQGQEWVRNYGSNMNANARYIIESYDNGFIFAAQINFGKYMWIFKTDINGEILWSKYIGTGNQNLSFSPMNIEQTVDNGYIICGTTTKYGSHDAFLIKLNSCADLEWCKVLITPSNYDLGKRVKVTPEGDYILLGEYFITAPESNISLFKFSESGDLIWQQFYPMEDPIFDDQPHDLKTDYDGYIISSTRYFPNPGTNSPGIARHFFIKTDTIGYKVWDLVYGANSYYYGEPWSIRISNSGNYYQAGNHFFDNGTGNPAFVKALHNGDPSYNKDVANGMSWGGLSSLDFLEDSLLVMMGRWYTDYNTPFDGYFKTDTLGNFRKQKTVKLLSNGYEATVIAKDNKFLSIGNDATSGTWQIYAIKVNSDLEYDSIYTQPMVYDSLCPNTIISDTINPDCDNVYVGVEQPFDHPESTKMNVFPNPAQDNITIELPEYLIVENHSGTIPSSTVYHQWMSTTLEVFDLSGGLVLSREIPKSTTSFQVDVSEWNRGMYLFRLLYKGHTVDTKKLFVVH